MLSKAGIVGAYLPLRTVKLFLMEALFGAPIEYQFAHDNSPLTFGDYVELLTKCANAYFRTSSTAHSLPDRLGHLVTQLMLTVETDLLQVRDRDLHSISASFTYDGGHFCCSTARCAR